MTTYYITLSLVFVCTLIAQSSINKQLIEIGSTQVASKRPVATKILFAFTAIALIFVAGLRYAVGTDYFAYLNIYKQYANEFWDSILTLDEPGFKFICWISVLIGGDGFTAIFLASLVTVFLFLRTIYKNTDMLLPATLLYIFLGCWHGAFNGIRQYLAAAVIFAGVRFIKEKKFWKYAFIVFIAFLFHSSALIMIFPYFIARNKISLPNILFLIISSVIILFSFSEVVEFTGFILNGDISQTGEYLTHSVNIFRILVAIAPALFFLFTYQKRPFTKEQNFWINMLILNAVMMVATSNSAYLARMGIYTAPFSTLGIPELINGLDQKEKKIATYIILILFFAYWVYEIYSSASLNNFNWVFNFL